MKTKNAYTLRKLRESRDLPPRTGPLAAANLGFHETYTRLVEDALAQLGERLSVLVMFGDDLTLLCDGEVQREEVIPAPYHELTALGHVAFGVQLTLIANGGGPLTDVTSGELRAKRAQIPDARAAADRLSKTVASQLPADLLRHVLALVDRALTDGAVDLKRLHHDIRNLASLALEMGRLAVRIELERLLYGEGLNEVDAALDLLARHIVDQRASRLLFGDRRHLQKDLLADVATAQLKELFSPERR